MNSLGFYARTYFDALNVAFAPLSLDDHASRKSARAVQNARAIELARAKAAADHLPHAA